MSKIKQWHSQNFWRSYFFEIHTPTDFPILSRLFGTEKMRHYDSLDNFNVAALIIANNVINSDKKRATDEITYVRNFYEKYFPKDKVVSAMYILDVYNKRLSREAHLYLYDELNRLLRPEIKRHLVHFVFEIAKADGKITNPEITEIFRLCKELGFSKKAINQFSAMYIANYIPYPEYTKDEDDYKRKYGRYKQKKRTRKRKKPSQRRYSFTTNYRLQLSYQILGISKHATVSQIKAAYRKLVRENHPDRFIKLGEIHVKQATDKIIKINKAYEYIKRIRRFT